MRNNLKNNNCDKSANLLKNSLTKKQLRGIKNLKSKMKNENLACGETDKTGKMTHWKT